MRPVKMSDRCTRMSLRHTNNSRTRILLAVVYIPTVSGWGFSSQPETFFDKKCCPNEYRCTRRIGAA